VDAWLAYKILTSFGLSLVNLMTCSIGSTTPVELFLCPLGVIPEWVFYFMSQHEKLRIKTCRDSQKLPSQLPIIVFVAHLIYRSQHTLKQRTNYAWLMFGD
jgi:hypothetical protein